MIKFYVLDLYADDAELHCSHSDLHVVETCLQSDSVIAYVLMLLYAYWKPSESSR